MGRFVSSTAGARKATHARLSDRRGHRPERQRNPLRRIRPGQGSVRLGSRRSANEHSSCWLRVATGWAHDRYGSMLIPRVGMEVLVGFLDGDADKPLVMGCLPNAREPGAAGPAGGQDPQHFPQPEQSRGGGYNELRIEDRKGAEEIYLRAQRNWTQHVLNDRRVQPSIIYLRASVTLPSTCVTTCTFRRDTSAARSWQRQTELEVNRSPARPRRSTHPRQQPDRSRPAGNSMSAPASKWSSMAAPAPRFRRAGTGSTSAPAGFSAACRLRSVVRRCRRWRRASTDRQRNSRAPAHAQRRTDPEPEKRRAVLRRMRALQGRCLCSLIACRPTTGWSASRCNLPSNCSRSSAMPVPLNRFKAWQRLSPLMRRARSGPTPIMPSGKR